MSIDMGKYCQVFADAPINGKMLKLLTNERLLAYGISDEVHRLYLLDEIAALFASQGYSYFSYTHFNHESHNSLVSHSFHHCPNQ
jgi:hypothetical protein